MTTADSCLTEPSSPQAESESVLQTETLITQRGRVQFVWQAYYRSLLGCLLQPSFVYFQSQLIQFSMCENKKHEMSGGLAQVSLIIFIYETRKTKTEHHIYIADICYCSSLRLQWSISLICNDGNYLSAASISPELRSSPFPLRLNGASHRPYSHCCV